MINHGGLLNINMQTFAAIDSFFRILRYTLWVLTLYREYQGMSEHMRCHIHSISENTFLGAVLPGKRGVDITKAPAWVKG